MRKDDILNNVDIPNPRNHVTTKFRMMRIERSLMSTYVGDSVDADGVRRPKYAVREIQTLVLTVVTGGSDENRKFFAATPGGEIRLMCVDAGAASMFDLNGEYFVTFTPAPVTHL